MNYIEFDNNRKFDITILGRASIDMIPTDFFKTLDECATFKKYIGGSPANIAIGMARLGRSVGFIGKVSDDSFGNFVLKGFEKENIDKLKEVVFAWKELFNEASEEFILLGFFNKKLDDYERWKCNKKQVIESLKKLIILCDKARKNNKIIRCRKITIKAQ